MKGSRIRKTKLIQQRCEKSSPIGVKSHFDWKVNKVSINVSAPVMNTAWVTTSVLYTDVAAAKLYASTTV